MLDQLAFQAGFGQSIQPIRHELTFKIGEKLPLKNKDGEEIHALRAADNSHLILISRRANDALKHYQAQKKNSTITLSDADINLLNIVFDQIGIKRL